jgi:cob(I)alamin adenosyltransferase
MKIYTRTGDAGDTGLFAGPRVSKDHPRIEACGTVDELNAALGQARATAVPPDIDSVLCEAQHELFAIGAELASPDPQAHGLVLVLDEHVSTLEVAIDRFESELAPLREFILPGGTALAASLHLARSICRRAERRVVTLWRSEPDSVSDRVVRYLNRLGDLLFVMSRAVNAREGRGDVLWRKPDKPSRT